MFLVGVKKPGAPIPTNAGVTALGSFSSYWGTSNIGAQYNPAITSGNNSTILQKPHGYGGVATTNGVTVFTTYTGVTPTNDNRVIFGTGMYGTTNTAGGPTSRLLLKG
jgi:hypothetical protein